MKYLLSAVSLKYNQFLQKSPLTSEISRSLIFSLYWRYIVKLLYSASRTQHMVVGELEFLCLVQVLHDIGILEYEKHGKYHLLR